MKIVVIASHARSLIQFRGALLDTLIKAGHEITAVAPEHDPASMRQLAEMGGQYVQVTFDRTGMRPLQDLKLLLRLVGFLRRHRPDLIFSYTAKPVVYGSLAARVVGTPHIVSMITGLGYAFTGNSMKQRTARLFLSNLYKIALRFNQAVFFQNPDDLALFAGMGAIRKSGHGTLVNGSGIDLEFYRPVPLPRQGPVFLLIGRLLKDKGIFEFVDAARQVKQTFPHARFRLLGPLDSNPAAITAGQLQTWQDEGIIEYLGQTTDVRPSIAEAGIYVLPSYREGTPRTVLEAMAMGRPVITTDAPGCRETVQDGENGFLVPVRDAGSLAAAMARFIEHPELVAIMGAKSRELAEAKYDVRKVNQLMMTTMGLLPGTGIAGPALPPVSFSGS